MVGEDCFLILEKYNEVKFLTRENADIAFDSKERFDLNFQGIMHHYYGRKI